MKCKTKKNDVYEIVTESQNKKIVCLQSSDPWKCYKNMRHVIYAEI